MTITEIINFIEGLPRRGVIEIDLGGVEIYAWVVGLSCEATMDGSLRIEGNTAYSIFSTKPSSMLINSESVRFVRHLPEFPPA